MSRILTITIVFLIIILSACSSNTVDDTAVTETDLMSVETPTLAPTVEPPTQTPLPVSTSTAEAVATDSAQAETTAEVQTPEAEALSFDAAVYQDNTLGIEFPYPMDWIDGDQMVLGDRAYAVQFTNGDNVVMQATAYLWDPKNDLSAYTAQRELAWDASGLSIEEVKELSLANGHDAKSYLVNTLEGTQAFFFFTAVGDRYLEISGEWNVELLAEIADHITISNPEINADAYETLGCFTAAEGTAEWVSCNVMDGIRSRNLSALHGYMADPFAIGYWASEGRSATPAEITEELMQYRLPSDTTLPITFTTDRTEFPPLQGMEVEGLFGPDLNVQVVLYSEGWGMDGNGAALLFIAMDNEGRFYWHGLLYSDQKFDKQPN